MAYVSTGSDAQRVQLEEQELIVTSADTAILSTSGSTVTIDAQQTLASVSSAVHIKDGAASPLTVSFANRAISGTTCTLTLTAPFAANDCIRMTFEVVN